MAKVFKSKQEKKVRTNRDINASEVRLIDAEGEQRGVVPFEEAITLAETSELDLVEISPNAAPPVCRVMDYGKYIFQLGKKHKTKTKKVLLKQINFRPGTEEEDYRVKTRKLIKFLEGGDKVKILIRFRGREMQHQMLGMQLMKRVEKDLEECGTIELRPRLEGRQMIMVLAPKKTG